MPVPAGGTGSFGERLRCHRRRDRPGEVGNLAQPEHRQVVGGEPTVQLGASGGVEVSAGGDDRGDPTLVELPGRERLPDLVQPGVQVPGESQLGACPGRGDPQGEPELSDDARLDPFGIDQCLLKTGLDLPLCGGPDLFGDLGVDAVPQRDQPLDPGEPRGPLLARRHDTCRRRRVREGRGHAVIVAAQRPSLEQMFDPHRSDPP
ncbi:hypothetical protein L3X23_25165 [Pseudonocardia sp. WMMC193]|nr:hypothetical protein [Pseudonocardia sp. WMMC193]MCF7552046.1 hypothetical protein [Pseudonocardia sp. WMMC193]